MQELGPRHAPQHPSPRVLAVLLVLGRPSVVLFHLQLVPIVPQVPGQMLSAWRLPVRNVYQELGLRFFARLPILNAPIALLVFGRALLAPRPSVNASIAALACTRWFWDQRHA